MLFIRDDERRGEVRPTGHPAHGLLQETVATEQSQKLLRIKCAGHWPQPCTRAAGQNDGMYHAISSSPEAMNLLDLRGQRHTPFLPSRKSWRAVHKKILIPGAATGHQC